MRNRSHFIGDLGEAAFVLRATQLRLPLYRPLSDKQGADFIADNRRQRPRIQVKTTGKRCSRNSYHVTIARGRRKSQPYRKSDIDFLVIPEDTFYILPQEFLKGRVALNVPSSRRKNLYAQYKEAWHLLLGKQPSSPQAPPKDRQNFQRDELQHPVWLQPGRGLTTLTSTRRCQWNIRRC